MELQRVSFGLSKKLKEVNFILDTFDYYDDSGDITESKYNCNHNQFKNTFTAPTLELAKMWFRVLHELDIEVYQCNIRWDCDIWDMNGNQLSSCVNFETYEEALEAGELKACEIIKTR